MIPHPVKRARTQAGYFYISSLILPYLPIYSVTHEMGKRKGNLSVIANDPTPCVIANEVKQSRYPLPENRRGSTGLPRRCAPRNDNQRIAMIYLLCHCEPRFIGRSNLVIRCYRRTATSRNDAGVRDCRGHCVASQ